jgi:hypothetical protein
MLPRLLRLLASRSTALLNFANLSRSIGIPQTTLKRYMEPRLPACLSRHPNHLWIPAPHQTVHQLRLPAALRRARCGKAVGEQGMHELLRLAFEFPLREWPEGVNFHTSRERLG